MLHQNNAEFWGRFEEFLAIFFYFFTKFFGNFWSAGSSHKPIQKTGPVPLVGTVRYFSSPELSKNFGF